MNNKEDFKAFLTDDRILDCFITGVYIIYARMYLSTRGDDHREAVRFFNSDFFKNQFGDKAAAIVEELNRKRRNHEKLRSNWIRESEKGYTTADDELLHGNKNV